MRDYVDATWHSSCNYTYKSGDINRQRRLDMKMIDYIRSAIYWHKQGIERLSLEQLHAFKKIVEKEMENTVILEFNRE